MSADEHGYLPDADGYFHTENDEAHQAQQSPETDLVRASRGEDVVPADEDAPADAGELSELTNAQLRALITERGIAFDGNLARASKADLLAALA